jgi:hypothetical protein
MPTTNQSSKCAPILAPGNTSEASASTSELSAREIERVCRAFLKLVQSVKETASHDQAKTEK